MSRIGRKPVPLPKGVTAQIDGQRITVKGPKGEIGRTIHPELAMALEDTAVVVRRPSDESRHKALHGLTRTLIANMVDGVTKGFAKALEIQGVGYKAEPKPFGVQLVVGFSHPVPYHAPQGIKISVENNVLVKVEGVDKELVGQVAAEIRAIRPPEPYKGKGVRYVGEQVRRKDRSIRFARKTSAVTGGTCACAARWAAARSGRGSSCSVPRSTSMPRSWTTRAASRWSAPPTRPRASRSRARARPPAALRWGGSSPSRRRRRGSPRWSSTAVGTSITGA